MPKAAKEMVMYSKWVPCEVKGSHGPITLSGDLTDVVKAVESLGVVYEVRSRVVYGLGEYITQRAVFADQEQLLKRGIDIAGWVKNGNRESEKPETRGTGQKEMQPVWKD